MSFEAKKLKYHSYFLTNVILRRPYLTEEKIENVLLHHEEKVVQENGRIAYTGFDLTERKYLKVIVQIENGEQVIFNAHYNRNFKKEGNL